ncbi:MAG: DUF1398 family protein [Crocinitomicaceae bacterium]|nr:DUF1398 family protein [Crocinitomicaceae bacterium]
MFTIAQIEQAHDQVKSGADFPKYIQELKKFGVQFFTTWVRDSHTEYFGRNGFNIQSESQYEALPISEITDPTQFLICLKNHQEGKTDYPTFCQDCAQTGIEKWIVLLDAMTCTYFDRAGEIILVTEIPA